MARQRYIVKRLGEGRKTVWMVYNRELGSFPYASATLGPIAQDHADEDSAARERDRVAAALGDTY